MRKPRLNKAVATVAVETVLSLLRVASESLSLFYPILVIPGRAQQRTRNFGFSVRNAHRTPEDG